MPQTTSYQVTDHFRAYIGEQVASGRYKSASEVMTDALRVHEERTRSHAKFLNAIDRAEVGASEHFDAKSFNEEMRARFPDPS